MLYRPCWSHRLMGKLPLVLVLTLILTPPLIIWLQRSGISISFVLDASPYGRLTGSANDSAAASSRSTPNAEVEKRTREFKIHQRPSTFPSSLGADQHVLGEARILARPSDKSNKEDSTFTEAAGGIISTSGGTQSPRVTVINAPPADPSEDLVLTNLLSKVKAEELVPEQERSQWIFYSDRPDGESTYTEMLLAPLLPPPECSSINMIASRSGDSLNLDALFLRVGAWSERFLGHILKMQERSKNRDSGDGIHCALETTMNATGFHEHIIYQPTTFLQHAFESKRSKPSKLQPETASILNSASPLPTSHLEKVNAYWSRLRLAQRVIQQSQQTLHSFPLDDLSLAWSHVKQPYHELALLQADLIRAVQEEADHADVLDRVTEETKRKLYMVRRANGGNDSNMDKAG